MSYWIVATYFTVRADIDREGIVQAVPPIVAWWKDKPIESCLDWLRKKRALIEYEIIP